MRRLNLSKNSRKAQDRESGADISAAAIIAKAAATVPSQNDDCDANHHKSDPAVIDAPSTTMSGSIAAGERPPRRIRRARWRPLRIAGDQLRKHTGVAFRLATLLALFGFPVWLWQSGHLDSTIAVVDQGASDAREAFQAALGLRLEHVYVVGRHRTSRKALSSVLGLDRGAALTGIGIAALRRRLRALPWISDAAIERRWPNVLFIRIREHTAIARYQNDGRMQLVASTGDVIDVDAAADHQGKLLIKGKGAPVAAAALLKILRSRPVLADRVVSATRKGQRRWDLTFDNGAFLKLPERRPDAAWHRFAALNKTHELLAKGALGFDMRTRFDFVIRKPGPVMEKSSREGGGHSGYRSGRTT
ncbi:MAG: FtsQ-type POTRA domain-containing protein [Rhodospirillaceae bacterium]|nr:FtsQ-type POTRA domain-containing protein [Rhodospirillaceae bacterium]MCY4310603.1 FtsQ-type POTRA domain-containing protein [Rhodospirillaceae bacterium]